MKKRAFCAAALLIAALTVTGCREADRVSANLSQSADNFNITRQITVFNTRTDTVLFQMTGRMSIKNDRTDELSVICEVEDGVYRKHFISLAPEIAYVVEDVSGAFVDKYHYELNILPEMIVPFVITSND